MTLSTQKINQNDSPIKASLSEALLNYRAGNIQKVEAILNIILEENPSCLEALKLLAILSHKNNQFDRAIACYQKIIAQIPNDIGFLIKLSWAYHQQRQFDLAIDVYNQILEIEPDNEYAIWHRALLWLKTGNYSAGFADFENKKNQPYYQDSYLENHQLWDGCSLNGKRILLYHSDDGFGDIIQLIRYVPLVKQQGGEVIVAVPKPLLRLFENVKGIDYLVYLDEPLPKFDVYFPLFSLPYRFQTTLETIPDRFPYLDISALKQKSLNNLVYLPGITPTNNLKIGFVWSSGHRDRNNTNVTAYRDCPLDFFLDLLSIPGISLYSLQVGTWAKEIEQYLPQKELFDLTPQINDFADTALLMSQLDLVIAVDTAIVHLAGAMGIPTWTLLAYDADWRWLVDRDDSPWYPSMKLFRQTDYGNWPSVFTQVKSALQNRLSK